MTVIQIVLAAILPWGLHAILGIFGVLVGIVIWLGGLALWILLMFKAYNNTPLVLPIIGPLAQKQAGQ